MKEWVYLFAAIVLEVLGTTSMKLSNGFEKLIPSILIFIFYGLSFAAFTLAVKRLEISVIYAIWSGLGTVLIAVIGMIYFKEPATLIKFISIALIIIGVIALQLSDNYH